MVVNNIYPPLNPGRSEIRLLRVLAREATDVPNFDLRTVSLDDDVPTRPPFTCVSYVWGEPEEKDIIINGRDIRVTIGGLLPAVDSALHHCQALRDCKPPDIWLWADALCINQRDEAEKNSQVPLMSRIFSMAELVVCCLWYQDDFFSEGLFTDAIRSIDELIARLQNAGLVNMQDRDLVTLSQPPNTNFLDCVKESPELASRLKDFGVFFYLNIPYWSRVWILQEVTLASNAIMTYKTQRVEWWKLKVLSRWRNEAIRGPKPDGINPKIWRSVATSGFDVVWSIIEVFALTKCSGTKPPANRTQAIGVPQTLQQARSKDDLLQDWLTSFNCGSSLKATNPRDHIYGLLAIAPIEIQVDYSQSVADVYSSYIKAYLRDWNSSFREDLPQLYFLQYAHCNPDMMSRRISEAFSSYLMPSWAPHYPFVSSWEKTHGLKRPQAPFGYQSSSCKGVFANDTTPAMVLNDDSGNRLLVSAIVLDGFSEKSLSFSLRKNTDILDVARGMKSLNKDVPIVDVLVKTIMWERLLMETEHDKRSSLLDDWECSCAEYLRKKVRTRIAHAGTREQEIAALGLDFYKSCVPLHTLDQVSLLRPDPREIPVDEFMHTLKWNLQFNQSCSNLILTESGRLCITGPFQVKPGDLLCILDGGSMPSILRPSGSFYKHICQTFVLGLENGQARGILERGEAKVQEFELI
ncbi:hypothetical protein PFICI_00169 [Pestalotiopsis fici W106-1]|uniref:Heterokaryon incompatibility domain-containing protein n=1 Tax=Pestalotiopsis fici (strain W106-1 / CGMCC3.15140) TaxID=1229662 RepID=W3XM53_PESFW|nr:uncharacterized protein PFICI_00169 [Pestalotiopsis fici W106-1]ETS86341.1 hypothetical protein PFICI_00169 [Pestalotiopsis fici W106-1]